MEPLKIKLSETPPSTSSIYLYHNIGKFISGYMSKKGRETKELYQWEMKSQVNQEPFEGDVAVKIKFFFKDLRRRDLDNHHKLILDAGTKILWEDDSQIVDLHSFKFIDKINPRVELEVIKL